MGTHHRQIIIGHVLLLASLVSGPAVQAGEASARAPLPEPLSLTDALSLAESGQPRLVRARADSTLRAAERLAAEAASGINVSVEGRLRWVEPSDIAFDQSNEDHKGSLFVRKNLYDFGRSDARLKAAEAGENAGRQRYLEAVRQQRLEVMVRFFDVLLADLQFGRDNEELAVVFVTLDRLRNRHELGQASDIDLLEMESQLQDVRRRLAESQAAQRSTRARLAIALDRPGMLPSNLLEPDLPRLGQSLPAYETLLEKALGDNAGVQAARAQLRAARERLAEAQAGGRPYLDGELEASGYSREMGSHDKWRAGVLLTVPLYTGGAVDAAVTRAAAELDRAEADLIEAERFLRERVLSLWLELQSLQVEAEQVRALQDYRDLYLDRSRTVYEQEVKADLGDAMVRLSEAQLAAARNRYRRALAWEELDALAGGLEQEGGV